MRSLIPLTGSLCLASSPLVAAESTFSPDPDPYPSLRVGGFTDIEFFATDEKFADGATSGFREGQFILHFSSALSSRWSFFAELSFTPGSDAFRTEVERTIVRFAQSDYLNLGVGRFHTPVNWWNVAFHHGQWLQTTIGRPAMIRFGGIFIPVHFVGGLVQGTSGAGSINVFYKGGIGNGRDTAISRAGDAGDANNHRAWLATLGLRPDRFYSLEIGGAVYRDRIRAEGDDYDEWIGAAWFAWTKESPEVIAEYAHVRHEADGGPAYGSDGYYVQVAYRLPGAAHRWKPYARYDRLEIDDDDPVFGGGGSAPRHGAPPPGSGLLDQKGILVGIRWDCSDFVALKAEGRRDEVAREEEIHSIVTQVSLAF